MVVDIVISLWHYTKNEEHLLRMVMIMRGVVHRRGWRPGRRGRMERCERRRKLEGEESTASRSPRAPYRLPVRHYSQS